MPKGQNTNSGPPPDPTSLKSAKRGLAFTALPAEGYRGEVPDFPLADADDPDGREDVLWKWAWSLPQAAAWAAEPWRQHAVAMWVRTARVCESLEATAADKNSLHRFADQIGLTPAGMAFNGWKIAADQVAAKRTEKAAPADPPAPTARDRWLKAAGGDA